MPTAGKTPTNSIKFISDPKLITVYGDDLPNHGLIVSPIELKKILKPFKEGEPNEVLHLENFTSKPIPLQPSLDLTSSPDLYSDIVDIKGGPINCDTNTPMHYRTSFTNFSSSLKQQQPRDPIIVDEEDIIEKSKNTMGRKLYRNPIIARAFGENKLLLRKDRGGLPYNNKPPIVVRNNYPIKSSR